MGSLFFTQVWSRGFWLWGWPGLSEVPSPLEKNAPEVIYFLKHTRFIAL